MLFAGNRHLRFPDKQHVAEFLQKVPWLMPAAQTVFRIWQPWVTIGVVGALFNAEGKLLIVEHVFHPKLPWGLPGGWMNRGEEPENTIRREMLEETGLYVEVIKPLVISRTKFMPAHLDVAFLCRLQNGQANDEIRLSSELLAYRWIDPREYPPMPNFHRQVMGAALAEMSNGSADLSANHILQETMIEDRT